MTILKTLKKFFFINTFIMIKEQFVLLKLKHGTAKKFYSWLIKINMFSKLFHVSKKYLDIIFIFLLNIGIFLWEKFISLISLGNYSTKEIKSCETFSFFITMGENITTEKIFLPIYPEFSNIKCLLKVNRVEEVDGFIKVFNNTTPFFYLGSLIIFGLFVFFLIQNKIDNKRLITALTFLLLFELLIHNFDFSYSRNTFILIFFLVLINKTYLNDLIKNNKTLILIFYIANSDHLTTFIQVNLDPPFLIENLFNIFSLTILLYLFNLDESKNSYFILNSLVPIIVVTLLVLNVLFFTLNPSGRYLYYFLFLILIFLVIKEIKFKIGSILGKLFQSLCTVLSIYLFPSFINSDLFTDKIYVFSLMLIFLSLVLFKKLNVYFLNNKVFSLFFLVFFITQINLSNFISFQEIRNRDIESSKSNINIVHILFDALPRIAIKEIKDENKIKDFHVYENLYSTGLNTQPTIIDMFMGDNFDPNVDGDYFKYFENSSSSSQNYLNKLQKLNVQTHLITDRFIGDVILQKNVDIFNTKYINFGDDEDFENYTMFYNNNVPNVYKYNLNSNSIKIFYDYVFNMLKINKNYDRNLIVERGALISIDNLSKLYKIYNLNKDSGSNYYYAHLQIPHTPFVMDSDCNYIEYRVGDKNNSESVVNGQIECAKKLIKIISEKFNSPNTLLIIHGDHSLDEVVLKNENLEEIESLDGYILENNDLIKQKLSSGLMIRYPDFNYDGLVNIEDKIFTTDIGGFIEKFFVNDSLYITNTFNKNYLNLVGGLAGNINNPRYMIKRLNISDW